MALKPEWYEQDDGSWRYWDGMEWHLEEPAVARATAGTKASAQTKPGRRTAPTPRIMGAVIALVVIGLVALLVARQSSAEKEVAEQRERVSLAVEALSSTVRYKVGGTATSANITVSTPGGTKQQQDVDVPLRSEGGDDYLEFTYAAGELAFISAENDGQSGTVTCSIEDEDGTVLASNESVGAHAIASCSAKAR